MGLWKYSGARPPDIGITKPKKTHAPFRSLCSWSWQFITVFSLWTLNTIFGGKGGGCHDYSKMLVKFSPNQHKQLIYIYICISWQTWLPFLASEVEQIDLLPPCCYSPYHCESLPHSTNSVAWNLLAVWSSPNLRRPLESPQVIPGLCELQGEQLLTVDHNYTFSFLESPMV